MMSTVRGLGALPLCAALVLSVGCTAIPSDPAKLDNYRQTSDDGPGKLSMIARGKAEHPRNLPKSRIGNPPSYEVFGQRYKVMDSAKGFAEQGVASWYGSKFHGRKTSSGEVYNMYNMTAAHKHLPLPTFVQVTNQNNGRSIIVKVTDRGPFVDDRIIDLSYAAASRLGMLDTGTANVEIVAISENVDPVDAIVESAKPAVATDAATDTATAAALASQSGPFDSTDTIVEVAASGVVAKQQAIGVSEARGTVIQVGAFSSLENADLMRQRVDQAMQDSAAFVMSDKIQALHRVQVGPLTPDAPVEEIIALLQLAGIEKVTIFVR